MQKTVDGVTTTVQFEYNEDGLRTKKTVTYGEGTVTTEYVLHGKNIVHLKNGTNEMHFFYDAQDKPAIVVFNGSSSWKSDGAGALRHAGHAADPRR